ncbi:MAG TPA: ATP-binding protein [Brevundimonas sp.]|jgi:signal transduction histidine kinase/CheY-like chemotaxis protein|uniref:ATP-binding protein n=1 Tax=Brevundimonas sp. TaxID=1871086 RepID=UPI002E137393|nr:ATP-binding protein [Brevundimonas sp.]
MAVIGDFVERLAPVAPSALGAEVFDRFQAEPDALAFAVVDEDGAPLGLIERHAFFLRMAAEFGRALYARRPVLSLMDAGAPRAEASTPADALLHSADAASLGALLRGFIVVEHGRYVGVGTALHLMQAGSALYRQRADQMTALAQELTRAEAEARASSRAKSEFLAVMSHEIRTPLNGVLGVAELIDRKLIQPELKPYVATILDSGQSLLRLLTDALDMSRAEAGALTLDPAPVSPDALARDVETLWRPRAEEKHLDFRVETAGLGDVWIEADGARLKQVLNNLIGNALKFTPEAGAVRVRLSGAPEDTPGRLRLRAEVSDTGPGVPEAAVEQIFRPFNTGQAGREGAGAGLGLAICRQIVEAMGGRIGLERPDGGGARFWLETSLPVCDAGAAAAVPEPVPPTPHETLHVLIADDNATNRFVAGKLLETFGCTHESVEDGAAAVAAVRARPFDLVLMDIKMPGMDGVAATRAIRELPAPCGRLPILALTANADPHDAVGYRLAGMDGVVEKPIRPQALLDAIRRALGPGETAAAVAAA